MEINKLKIHKKCFRALGTHSIRVSVTVTLNFIDYKCLKMENKVQSYACTANYKLKIV